MWDDISLWFWLAFPWWLVMLNIFSCICWPAVCVLWKNVYSDILPLFKLDYLFFCYWVIWVFYISWLLAPFQIYDLQWFSPIPSIDCLFISLIVSFAVQKFFYLLCLLCSRHTDLLAKPQRDYSPISKPHQRGLLTDLSKIAPLCDSIPLASNFIFHYSFYHYTIISICLLAISQSKECKVHEGRDFSVCVCTTPVLRIVPYI